MDKIPNPCNTKEHYQSFIKNKNTKSVKRSKLITYQPKIFRNRNIVDIKWVLIDYRKRSHNLSKALRQTEKVGSNSSLYSNKKIVKCLNKKNN